MKAMLWSSSPSSNGTLGSHGGVPQFEIGSFNGGISWRPRVSENTGGGSVWPTVFVSVDPLTVRSQRGFQVITRVTPFITGHAITNLQINDVLVGSVHQLMSDALRWKPSAHARCQRHLFSICDECRFPFQHINQLVLPAVAMQKRRLAARCEPGQVHPEVLEAKEIAERLFLSFSHAAEEGLWIGRGLCMRRS
jgi:hypothetical protein